MSEQNLKEALELFEEGKLDYKNGIYDASVSKLGEACQLLDQIHGDLSIENGDAYFYYGQSLLQYAIQQNSVLGQSAEASAKKVKEQQELVKEEEVQSNNPLVQLNAVPDFTEPESEEEEEEEEEGQDDFEAAWDVLDVARLIFEKSKDKESQLKLADVHLCLGDVSLETEKFNEALVDYEKAIEIKKGLLSDDDRELAECHYKYALALEFSTEKADQAIPELRKAIDVLNKRIESITDEKEIKEIKEFIPDMELKIEELTHRQATEKEAEALLKSMLGKSTEKVKEINPTAINDLSTLVKRKAKPTEEPEKKQKLE